MPSRINDEKCNKCAACVSACPTGSISEGTRAYVVDSDTCQSCLACAKVCPKDAVENPAYQRPRKNRKSPRPAK